MSLLETKKNFSASGVLYPSQGSSEVLGVSDSLVDRFGRPNAPTPLSVDPIVRMLAREDFASELFGSQHRVTGITGDSLVGYSAPYKAAHRIFVHPLPHFTSTHRGSEPEFCLWCTLPHSAVQRYPAIVHLSKNAP